MKIPEKRYADNIRIRDDLVSVIPGAAKPQIRSPNFEIPKNYGRKNARKMRGCWKERI